MEVTRYAKSGDVNVAYQAVGEGPRDLVYVPGWVSNIEVMWEELTTLIETPQTCSLKFPTS
ncbi:MAG: hypothetical protein M5U23_10780 [Acidimicrobiia bacterium]|nr:hypothetical protein [Acidimicrobiia bacterium]